jgi:hypothetical protein
MSRQTARSLRHQFTFRVPNSPQQHGTDEERPRTRALHESGASNNAAASRCYGGGRTCPDMAGESTSRSRIDAFAFETRCPSKRNCRASACRLTETPSATSASRAARAAGSSRDTSSAPGPTGASSPPAPPSAGDGPSSPGTRSTPASPPVPVDGGAHTAVLLGRRDGFLACRVISERDLDHDQEPQRGQPGRDPADHRRLGLHHLRRQRQHHGAHQHPEREPHRQPAPATAPQCRTPTNPSSTAPSATRPA